MSTGHTHHWWAIGLRGVAAVVFGLAVVTLLPSSTTAALVMLFAVYIAADGFLAVLVARRAGRRTRRGILLATIGPNAIYDPHTMALWLIAYAALFGITLLILGFHMRRRHHQSADLAARLRQYRRTIRPAGPPLIRFTLTIIAMGCHARIAAVAMA
jgi:uncharacterized membrane protein HdeD (DUF308 family)